PGARVMPSSATIGPNASPAATLSMLSYAVRKQKVPARAAIAASFPVISCHLPSSLSARRDGRRELGKDTEEDGAKRYARRTDGRRGLLVTGREGFVEHALAGRALLDRENGAQVVLVEDRDVEPRPFLQRPDIALILGLGRVEADQEEVFLHLHGDAG